MSEQRTRPPRAHAPFFVAGGDNDFYGSTHDEDINGHSDSELNPSASSHSPQMFASAADMYRSLPTNSPDQRLDAYPPSPTSGTPQTGRPLVGGNFGPSGYTPSPSNSRPNSYRFSYAAQNPRAFPPSAFVDPAAPMPFPETPGSSLTGHGSQPGYPRMSTDESLMSGRPIRTIGQGQRTSSMTSFAPPPAPWLRSELDSSRVSMASSGGKGTLTPKKRAAAPSTLLRGPVDKPWLEKRDPWATASWWITFLLFFLGVAGSAVLCFFGIRDVPQLGQVCMVMNDNFDSLDLDTWHREAELGGFGNGQFEMTVHNDKNSHVEDGKLYITPTLTSEEIGDEVFDGGRYEVEDCTNRNRTACRASSNAGRKQVINPVQSARLNTKGSKSIQYGRVEVRARLPKGNWIRPAIWMLPEEDTYGPFPMSGGIDIMTARGNDGDYPAGGRNFVTGALNWGPAVNMNQHYRTNGWRSRRRGDFSDDYHTYSLEWTPDYIWIYVDRRVDRMLDLRMKKKDFFSLGQFPKTVVNGTQEVVLQNPWEGEGNSAPFNKPFYLIMNVAIGGTSGWWPDEVGGKPWFDGSASAMYDFANAQSEWTSTWPGDLAKRSLAVDYVKMWQLGRCQ